MATESTVLPELNGQARRLIVAGHVAFTHSSIQLRWHSHNNGHYSRFEDMSTLCLALQNPEATLVDQTQCDRV